MSWYFISVLYSPCCHTVLAVPGAALLVAHASSSSVVTQSSERCFPAGTLKPHCQTEECSRLVVAGIWKSETWYISFPSGVKEKTLEGLL